MAMNITPKQYFIVTGLLSLLWIFLYILAHPSWTQSIQELLGLETKLQATDDSFYNSRIDPIFEKYCVACHSDKKDKGSLRLDSFRYLNFSGKSAADLTQDTNNLLIERMSLPENDRLAMPPYGRERHTPSELNLIKLWLEKGGSGIMTEAEFPEAPPKAKIIKFTDIDWQQIEKNRQSHSQVLQELQKKFPHVLHYKARTSSLVVLEAFSVRKHLDDDLLLEFEPLSAVLAELHLNSTQVTDKAFDMLLKMPELSVLNLSNTSITKARLTDLLALSNLQSVTLDHNLIDEPLKQSFAQHNIRLIPVSKE